ncbi:MAG: 23S rRNA (guanosine(2251)-2'-O)-methyltransferase RlmB [Clostridia bacterium]|nr:23S rRNA (guanosine(2251)-2'-O)-methyltransferase RlmB [Clostridia bacterium]
MIIEGKNAVYEAMKSETTIEKLYIEKGNFAKELNRIIAVAREQGIKISFEKSETLEKLSPSGRHQGVIATTTEYKYFELEDIVEEAKAKGEDMLFIILDGVEDPHNLGAVIRVADCAGATGVIVPKHRGVGVTDTVVKVSAGASAHVKVAKVTNTNDAIRYLKDQGVFVFAADMDGESIYRTNLTGNIALVIGGEGSGVHSLTRKLSDGIVSLPLFGKVNSLNASVATGIVVYEAIRQRNGK